MGWVPTRPPALRFEVQLPGRARPSLGARPQIPPQQRRKDHEFHPHKLPLLHHRTIQGDPDESRDKVADDQRTQGGSQRREPGPELVMKERHEAQTNQLTPWDPSLDGLEGVTRDRLVADKLWV